MTTIRLASPQEAADWQKNNDITLIDVREPEEFQAISIPGAHHMPLGDISLEYVNSIHESGKKLVIQCRSGARSMMACQQLKHAGIACDLWNLDGGILAWKAVDLPVNEA